MIVITGAAGFIGSALITALNEQGLTDLVLVDLFGREDRERNFQGKKFRELVDRGDLHTWMQTHEGKISFVFHLGARTDTTGTDVGIYNELNLHFSQMVFRHCVNQGIPLIYASSAATYGGGEHGFSDDLSEINKLRPLNLYGESKHDFDLWVLKQKEKPPFWAGFKFFNVFGPNEYHKGRMASVVFHTFRQIRETGGMKLFRSHRPDVKDGHQSRDFIYIKDLLKILMRFYEIACAPDSSGESLSGIYNAGTGKARTFLDLVHAVFTAMGIKTHITFVDTPEDIRETYQYFTEADMEKVQQLLDVSSFFSLEEAVMDYVQNYLQNDRIY